MTKKEAWALARGRNEKWAENIPMAKDPTSGKPYEQTVSTLAPLPKSIWGKKNDDTDGLA